MAIRRLLLEDARLAQGESTPEQRQRQASSVGLSPNAAEAAARPSLARANPMVQVVTVPGSDHNIHRGQFDAFMVELEPFLEAG